MRRLILDFLAILSLAPLLLALAAPLALGKSGTYLAAGIHARYARDLELYRVQYDARGRNRVERPWPIPRGAGLPVVVAAFSVLPIVRLGRLIHRTRRENALRRWAAVGACPRCGYDLRATPRRCPECGEKPWKSARRLRAAAAPLTAGLRAMRWALLGLSGLSLALSVAGWAQYRHMDAFAVPGYPRMHLEVLATPQPWRDDLQTVPERLRRLDGQPVQFRAQILPGRADGQDNSFAACEASLAASARPQVTEFLIVRQPDPRLGPYDQGRLDVYGAFRIRPRRDQAGHVRSLYEIDAERIRWANTPPLAPPAWPMALRCGVGSSAAMLAVWPVFAWLRRRTSRRPDVARPPAQQEVRCRT